MMNVNDGGLITFDQGFTFSVFGIEMNHYYLHTFSLLCVLCVLKMLTEGALQPLLLAEPTLNTSHITQLVSFMFLGVCGWVWMGCVLCASHPWYEVKSWDMT